ncbi:tetratricopeptide repeat protein [Risungbinella massiliensis]|uniref:tetratricopeptide repeat protein n=1 Tax=Risungbinella massiliensis TaxID=1329796 RepID=UPI0005CC6C9D|nr:tetratricopeptide repeat protein [Risungbinella massiliensis]
MLESMALDESHPYIGTAYYIRGLCYLKKNKWRQAERNLHHALRHAQQSNQPNPELEAQIYYQLSKCHQAQYSLVDAIDRVNQGLRVLEDAKTKGTWKERLLCQKAEYHYLLKETLEGYQFVLDHWETLAQSTDCEIRTTISWLRAEFVFQLGYLEQSIEIASHAVEQSQHLSLPLIHNRLWTLLGKVYTHTENWDLADLSFQMALRQNLHPSTVSYDPIYTLIEYSKLYQKQEKWQPAYTYLEKAVSLSKKHLVKDQYLSTLLMLGNLCHECGQKPDEAIRLLQQTLELAQKYEKLDLELEVWFSLAKCYEHCNDEAFHHCLRKGYELRKRVSQEEQKRKSSVPK